jgi:hypothetical protein
LEEEVFPTTFYPGTTIAERAGLLTIGAGEEVEADVVLTPTGSGTLRGSIAKDRSAGDLLLGVQTSGPFGSKIWARYRERVYGGGFELPRLAVGRYVISAWDGIQMVARQVVDMNPGEQSVTLGNTPLAQVSVIVEMASAEPEPKGQVALALTETGREARFVRALERAQPTVFSSVPPGKYTVSLAMMRQWPVLSVRARGATISGGVIDIPETGKVELAVLTDPNSAQVEGKLVRRGRPVAGAIVVLAPRATFIDLTSYRVDQTNNDGSFDWYGVVPGDHLMFVFEEGEASDYADPATLRQHLKQARRLQVTGEAKQRVRCELEAVPE